MLVLPDLQLLQARHVELWANACLIWLMSLRGAVENMQMQVCHRLAGKEVLQAAELGWLLCRQSL